MAHKKGQGSSKNGRDSNPQFRGVKVYGGQAAPADTLLQASSRGGREGVEEAAHQKEGALEVFLCEPGGRDRSRRIPYLPNHSERIDSMSLYWEEFEVYVDSLTK